ncbi:hypothetical protein BaRGS_00030089 [Batillaria attramentaria]|uniref:Ig-like domain-containing protein n=1 Tax=Batillaria attramentaria TaxID=370345 RepID=A0ABD0JVG5_9CAEN
MFLFLCPDTLAFKWTDTVPKQVSVCVGKPAVFSWNFAVDTKTEIVLSTTWLRVVNGRTQDLLEARMGDFDFGMKAVPNQVAALKLKSAALSDAGTYIVNVTYMTNTESGQQSLTVSRSAELIVWKAPSTTDDQLHVVLDLKAVKIQTGKTSEWRVRLSCGTFLGLGQPNVSVVWKTPSDKTLPSTSYDRGAFHLVIDRTEAGLYSCQIDPKAPALTCLDPNSFLLSNVDIYVSQADVRLLVLEADSAEQKAENAKQKAQNAKQKAELAEQKAQLAEQKAQLAEQKAQLGEQKAQLGEQKAQLGEQKAQLAEQKAQLGEQKAQLAEQKAQLGEQKAQLGKQKAQLGEQKAQLGEQKAQLGEQKAQLGEQKAQLGEQKAQLAEQKAQLGEQKAQLAEQKAQLGEQKAQLGEQKAQLGEQKAQLGEQKAQLREQKAQLAEQKTKLAEQKAQNAKQEASIAKLPTQLSESTLRSHAH